MCRLGYASGETMSFNPSWLANLQADTTLNISSEKRKTLVGIGRTMLLAPFELAFVAGMLGNIYIEGAVGHFESSAYISQPEEEPQYLVYMDRNYSYRSKYSGHNITEFKLSDIANLLTTLKNGGWKGKFGIGCVQWTGDRSITLLNLYKNTAGSDKITFEKAMDAEGKMIVGELNGTYGTTYSKVYPNWKAANSGNLKSSTAARNAGVIICKNYEQPYADTSSERGSTAEKIYKIMTGK
jgi:hypothetical protein